eukprot:945343-Ditylum_brightwellii.AAC.1
MLQTLGEYSVFNLMWSYLGSFFLPGKEASHEESSQISEELPQVSDKWFKRPSLREDINKHYVMNCNVECNTENNDVYNKENFEEAKIELHKETDVADVDTEILRLE